MSDRKPLGVLASFGYMLSTIWRADKACVIFSFYKQVTEELFVAFFVVYFTKTFYSLVQNNQPWMEVVWLALIFCGLHVLIHIASALHAYYIRLKTPEVYRSMFSGVMDKAHRLELRRYEQPDFYNRFARALDECLTKAMDGLYSFTLAVGEGLAVLVSIILVAMIDPMLLLFLLPPVAASFWLGGQRNKLQFALNTAETPYQRVTSYAKRVFFEKKYASEIRLYGIREVLFRQHRESYMTRYGITVDYNRKIFFRMLAQQLLMFCFMSASISLYITYVLKVKGTSEVGAYIAVLTTAGYITWKAGDTVQKAIEAGKHCLFMNNLRDFLEAENEGEAAAVSLSASPSGTELGAGRVGQVPGTELAGNHPDITAAPLEAAIRPGAVHSLGHPLPVPPEEQLGDLVFEDVHFAYEGSATPVLDGLTLSIRRGERIALVGENGAGKTTLVKLLMGLYPIRDGRILVNGRDIRTYEAESYRQRFGTVFQDLQIFSLTLAENVLLREPETEADRQTVAEALGLAQFGETLAKLPAGIDTPVSKEFDDSGFVCSGGQAQKIALARIFAKKPDIVILDEPSSALDPLAEYYMYQNMLQASAGRTVFFISHRLSSARIADRIIYLENGRVAESGTHQELMEKDGHYSRMFRLQAQNYQDQVWQTVEGKELYGN